MPFRTSHNEADVARMLQERGINPTAQRVLITRVLLGRGTHLAAEEIFRAVNKDSPSVSKATVYNTLGLLARQGIIREVIADPERVFYDPNTAPHHHLYDEVSGELTDIDAADVSVTDLPRLPEGAELQSVDIIIRVRRNPKK